VIFCKDNTSVPTGDTKIQHIYWIFQNLQNSDFPCNFHHGSRGSYQCNNHCIMGNVMSKFGRIKRVRSYNTIYLTKSEVEAWNLELQSRDCCLWLGRKKINICFRQVLDLLKSNISKTIIKIAFLAIDTKLHDCWFFTSWLVLVIQEGNIITILVVRYQSTSRYRRSNRRRF